MAQATTRPDTSSYTPPPNLFLLHDSHQQFLDGTSRHLIGTRRYLILAIFVVIVALTMFTFRLPDVLRANAIEHSGNVVQGTVTHREDFGGDYYLVFEYQINKGPGTPDYASAEQQVSLSTFDRLTEGTAVTISYDAGNPRIARLTGSDADDTDVTWNIPGGVVFGIILLLGDTWIFRLYLRKKRLAREGRVIEGTLTALSGSYGRWGYRLSVKYKFNSPSGHVLEGRDLAQRTDPDKTDTPIGTPVAVVYTDDKCYSIL